MPEEIHELQEHAEHAAHVPSLVPVTMTMAIFAVLVAAVGLLGHRSHTEELLLQTKATDQWAYYQAKGIRRRSDERFIDATSVFTVQNAAQAETVRQKYEKEVDRYRDEQKDIQSEARKAEEEVMVQRRRADKFDLGEVLLEAALVICSITLLTRKRLYWLAGLLLGFCALVIGASGLFIR
jgi:hypothetical protein